MLCLVSIAASIWNPSSIELTAWFNAPGRQRLRRNSAAKDGTSWQIMDEISGL
jgi:hypothetical protein